MYSKFMSIISVLSIFVLQACGAGQQLTFEPLANMHGKKYARQKLLNFGGGLAKGNEAKGFFLKLSTKI